MNLQRIAALLIAPALILSTLTACTQTRSSAPVVVTTNILGDITRALIGDQVGVITLMPANADPHSFGVSAQDALAMQEADLLVANGLGLEEGLSTHIDAARAAGVTIFEAGAHVDVLDYATDDASGPDPHWWTDPTQMAGVVRALEESLTRAVDGIDTQALHSNASAYLASLDELDRHMNDSFASIAPSRRALVTNHHVFGYLARRYGFTIIGVIIPGGTTLASPSASDLADLADAITTARVPAIFAESSSPTALADALAAQAGVDVEVVPLYTESLTEPGTEAATYLDMMRINTQRITGALTR